MLTRPTRRTRTLAAMLGLATREPAEPRNRTVDGLCDHLLRDIGLARGTFGHDRRNRRH